MQNLSLGILIPVFNNLAYTQKCLKNLVRIIHSFKLDFKMEIILIDDGSTDGTSQWVSNNFRDVHLLKGDGNLWWSGGINMGAKFAKENLGLSHVLLWNNDILIEEAYFKNLASIIDQNPSVLIGSKIYADMEEGIVWSFGGKFNPKSGKKSMIGFFEKDGASLMAPIEADWLTGMGTVVPLSIVDEIGYWDAENFPQYHGDTDFTFRAKKKGFKLLVFPELKIWNDVTNTGISHDYNFKKFLNSFTDIRSKLNFSKAHKFYRLHASSPIAFVSLYITYLKIIGGFIKWKMLSLVGIKRNS